ncbi:hypothetical protein ACMA1I_06715 [Pontibacter sp. 13R65]|uniref:hypothetical protein n=1 Tax=Pontibacter sp. 13R65 TaxID=3127458 RepID=UPI00301CE8FE
MQEAALYVAKSTNFGRAFLQESLSAPIPVELPSNFLNKNGLPEDFAAIKGQGFTFPYSKSFKTRSYIVKIN